MKLPILFILASLPLLFSCSLLNQRMGLEDNHILEQTAEFGIKAKTNAEIDLTPSSPE